MEARVSAGLDVSLKVLGIHLGKGYIILFVREERMKRARQAFAKRRQ